MNGLSLFNLFGINSQGKAGNDALFQVDTQPKGNSLFNRIFGMVLGGFPGLLKKQPAAPQFPSDLASWGTLTGNSSGDRAQNLGQLLAKAAYPNARALEGSFLRSGNAAKLGEVVVLPSGQAVSSEQLAEKLLTAKGKPQIVVVQAASNAKSKSSPQDEVIFLALPVVGRGEVLPGQTAKATGSPEEGQPVVAEPQGTEATSPPQDLAELRSGQEAKNEDSAQPGENLPGLANEMALAAAIEPVLENETSLNSPKIQGEENPANPEKSEPQKPAGESGWFQLVLKSGEQVFVAVPVEPTFSKAQALTENGSFSGQTAAATGATEKPETSVLEPVSSAKPGKAEGNSVSEPKEQIAVKTAGSGTKNFLLIPLKEATVSKPVSQLLQSSEVPQANSAENGLLSETVGSQQQATKKMTLQLAQDSANSDSISGVLVHVDSVQVAPSGKSLRAKKGQKINSAVTIQEVTIADTEPDGSHWLALEKMSQALEGKRSVLKEVNWTPGKMPKSGISGGQKMAVLDESPVPKIQISMEELTDSQKTELASTLAKKGGEKENFHLGQAKSTREEAIPKNPKRHQNSTVQEQPTAEKGIAKETQLLSNSSEAEIPRKPGNSMSQEISWKKTGSQPKKLAREKSLKGGQGEPLATNFQNTDEINSRPAAGVLSEKEAQKSVKTPRAEKGQSKTQTDHSHSKKLLTDEGTKPFARISVPRKSSHPIEPLSDQAGASSLSGETDWPASPPRPEHLATKISVETLEQSSHKASRAAKRGEKLASPRPEQKTELVGHPAGEKNTPVFEHTKGTKPAAENANSARRSASFSQLTRASFDKLVRHTRLLVQNQGGQMQIQLKPDVLGGARVLVEALQNQVSVKILVDKPETRHILEQHVQALHAAVAQQSGRVQEIQISIHVQSDATSQQQTQNQGQNQRSGTSQQNEQNKNFSPGYGRETDTTEDEKIVRKFGYNSMEMVA